MWENRITLFVGYLIDNGKQSSTVKSNVSAIKAVLTNHGIKINEDQFLINSLTKACRLINDRIRTWLPIQKDMLAILLNQIDKHFDNVNQPYLKIMYKALFSTAYFGLFRISELTAGEHTVRVKDIQLGSNKRKLLFILWTSKTHRMDVKPQMIKITSSSKKSKKYKYNNKPNACLVRMSYLGNTSKYGDPTRRRMNNFSSYLTTVQ